MTHRVEQSELINEGESPPRSADGHYRRNQDKDRFIALIKLIPFARWLKATVRV